MHKPTRLACPIVLQLFAALVALPIARAGDLSFSGVGGQIPDTNATGFVSEITIPDGLSVVAVRVRITQLVHGWCGELILTLEKEGGPTAVLAERIGALTPGATGDSSNFSGDYTFSSDASANIWQAAAAQGASGVIPPGAYQTSGFGSGANNHSLDAFIGPSVAGVWRLRVADRALGITGNLQGWSLIVIDTPDCSPCGDANCDGFVTIADIGFFVAALSAPANAEAVWQALFPNEDYCNFLCANDTNDDGFVTISDIGAFVNALIGTPCTN